MGTPRELTSNSGEIAWETVYQAWGNTVTVEWQEVAKADEFNPIQLNAVEQSYLLQPHRFQGQIYDVETGLHYNRFRYYDPDAGRFISHDPIGLLGGDNNFQYAPNPVGWVDPFGLAKISNSTGAYSKVGGHHVHAKAGFKNAPNFKELSNKMFSLGNDWMKSNGISHDDITKCQRKKFKDLELLGCDSNTMKAHTKIAVECLMEGGADEKTARHLVAKSLNELRKLKVTQPNHIPWSK